MDENENDKLNQRQKKILEILQTRGDISVTELAERFNVHPMTIRRDIKKFEHLGIKLIRKYGGAQTQFSPGALKYLSSEDIYANIDKKVAIAQYIVDNILKDNDFIFLNSGSTLLQIAKALVKRKKMTVATNSIDIMAELYHRTDINTLILGGSLSVNSSSLHGPYAVERLKGFKNKVDFIFLSCDGVLFEQGFFTNSDIEANLNPIVLDIGVTKCLAADSSKINKRAPFKFADFNDIDIFITDSGIKEDQLLKLKREKIDIKIAPIKPL